VNVGDWYDISDWFAVAEIGDRAIKTIRRELRLEARTAVFCGACFAVSLGCMVYVCAVESLWYILPLWVMAGLAGWWWDQRKEYRSNLANLLEEALELQDSTVRMYVRPNQGLAARNNLSARKKDQSNFDFDKYIMDSFLGP
jgi:hypothetical protein